jgi:hypothetical protein
VCRFGGDVEAALASVHPFVQRSRSPALRDGLKHLLPDAVWFDLLRTQTVLDISRDPNAFRHRIEAGAARELGRGGVSLNANTFM